MKYLRITKGDWAIEPGYDDKRNQDVVEINTELVECLATVWSGGSNNEETEANAKLIADAGTTANRCGLLPSELLEQRYDLAEALKHALEIMYQCEPPKELFETYANAYANYHNLIQDINYDNPAT